MNGHRSGRESACADRFRKDLSLAGIRGTGLCYRDEIDPAECPVREEEAALVLLGKVRVAIAGHTGRRTAAQIADRRHTIEKVGRLSPELVELRRSPATISPRYQMIEPARFVPWQTHATFVVGIAGKGFAIEIEVERVRV